MPQAKHWVDVENGNILKTMLAQMLTGHLSVKQAAPWRARTSRKPSTSRRPLLSGSEHRAHSRRRDRRVAAAAFTGRRLAGGSVPYLLVVPVVPVLAAILGYPIYYLVRLSLQKYGLFELIAHHGSTSGSTTSAPSSTTRSSGTRCYGRSSSPP